MKRYMIAVAIGIITFVVYTPIFGGSSTHIYTKYTIGLGYSIMLGILVFIGVFRDRTQENASCQLKSFLVVLVAAVIVLNAGVFATPDLPGTDGGDIRLIRELLFSTAGSVVALDRLYYYIQGPLRQK